MKKLPLGTQSFEVLRNDETIYVDKTQHIFNLITNGRIYFLSRPRRFGKSLLINTFKELFKGNKGIFEGLYIYDKWDWSKLFPVIHLDFTELAYDSPEKLKGSLFDFVKTTARHNNVELQNTQLETMFAELIEQLHQTTGQQVVLLIDEYDKPMIDSLNKAKEMHQQIKETLHNFYQVIKGSDEHIKFMFMTGVSRFAGLSVFSALNNLNDITIDYKYISICGYTQEELESSFKEYIQTTAEYMHITKQALLSKIQYWYNGYSWDGKTYVYNPFSTLSFFDKKKFEGYWFSTGTPTFLIEQIKKKDDLEILSEPKIVSERTLRGNSNYANVNSAALLFQTGYLTIKKEEIVEDESQYTIDFPNYEVKSAFLGDLLEAYTNKDITEVQTLRAKLIKTLRSKDSISLQEILKSLYANIPYNLHISKEAYYHSLFILTCKLAGFEVQGEEHTDKGRIDVVLKKDNIVVIVEIKYCNDNNKLQDMLNEGMAQIRRNKYYEKYTNNNPILLGIVFSETKDIACRFENV